MNEPLFLRRVCMRKSEMLSPIFRGMALACTAVLVMMAIVAPALT
jgi:hypothetical protein